ncbi:alpha/beta fold hydrolase [Chloroflexota bacterium]
MPKAKVNEININYKVEGQGEPLVMIMGLATGGYFWLFQTRVFKKHYLVITFDNRGVGKTDKPSGPYTTKMMAEDTIGLMDYLAIDRAHILGVSMGGMIAQELAINHPDRVKKLALGCTYANAEIAMDEIAGVSPELRKVMESVGVSNASNRRALSTLFIHTFNSNKWFWRMISPILSWILFIRGWTSGIMGQYEATQKHDTLDRLHMIEAPTLVITGTADRLVPPSSSDVIAGRIPNAKLVKVENGSHAFFFEMRGKFNQEVLDFLESS